MKTSTILAASAVILGSLLSAPSGWSQMTWSAPVSISGDSDVSTTGLLTYAYVFGGTGSVTSQTVNGVTFSPFAIPGQESGSLTVGNATLSATEFNWNVTSSDQAPYANLSSDYQGLLGENAFSHGGALTLTLGGLTAGQTYEVQIWINNSFNSAVNYSATVSDGSQGSSAVSGNTSGQIGGLGQYVIGVVTLGGEQTDLQLTLSPVSADAGVNAVQIRAVPEPGVISCALVGSAVVGWMALRRARRSTVS
ncbi:hypothetical protein DB345_05495 [Spartobacteria bacterium LR76]|nr:hypothetical protein DB345_05495 [Spartobacteria bacterium LR76]